PACARSPLHSGTPIVSVATRSSRHSRTPIAVRDLSVRSRSCDH
ncbi:unnamed protein product, partial [Staurois parvus]